MTKAFYAAIGGMLILQNAVMTTRADAQIPVGAQGETRIISRSASGPVVSATITTRLAPAEEAVGHRAARCSGGRAECSLVDGLTLSVGGKALQVPPRAILLLADVDDGAIRVLGGGRYELILTCGDAAPAYQARFRFTAHRVTRLDIWSDEAGRIEQRTTFRDIDKAFR